MSDVELAIPQLLKDEGSTFILNDSGRGPCKYGILLSSYRIWFSTATVETLQAMTADEAAAFYRIWWTRYSIGRIIDQSIAAKCFNVGFDIGAVTAIEILQATVNSGVKVDGLLGPLTAAAINTADSAALLTRYKAALVTHYRAVVRDHPQLAGNLPDWEARANA